MQMGVIQNWFKAKAQQAPCQSSLRTPQIKATPLETTMTNSTATDLTILAIQYKGNIKGIILM